MNQLHLQQFRHPELKALSHGLTGALCLLFILMLLGPGIDDKALGALQENSLNFFVQCNTYDCSSLIIPFVAYLFDIEKNLGQLFILWLAINTGLIFYLYFQLAQTPIKPIHAFAISTLPLILVVLNAYHPSYLIAILPCALSALLASAKYTQGEKTWPHFVSVSVLFNLPMGLLLFGSQLCYLMSTKEGKKNRRDIVRIVHSIALSCAIITTYLLLIEYSFFELENTDVTSASSGNTIMRSIGLTFSYITIAIAMISTNVKKIK